MQVKVEHVTKRYRDADHDLVVINDLTFCFPPKGSVAIIGRSGIGKSTLLHLLGGLDTPTSGRIVYDSTDVSGLSVDARARFRATTVGFIFQFHHLLPEFSARENVTMPLIIGGVIEDEAVERAEYFLRLMGLTKRMDHLPSQLSGGEQQRVAIARALVTEPRVVLADEPTGNLDVKTAEEVQELLLESNRRLESTLIVVTHNTELARNMDMAVEMLPGGNLVSVG
jgi:lipoprotein-releasing system ATP-binding protein